MEKYSIQGRAESTRWKREATLKDLLDLLDEIRDCDKTPEEKAKLTQKVIDYGQHLSEEIYLRKRPVPEDETMSVAERNEIRKKFNIRMYSSYYTKGESSYEEAQRPTGYFDEKGQFIEDPYIGENPGTRNHKNPRWHPLPFIEDTTTPPGNEGNDDNTGGGGTTGVFVPPTVPENSNTGTKVAEGGTSPVSDVPTSENITEAENTSKKEKRRRRVPLWLIPPVVGAALLFGDKSESSQKTEEKDPKAPTELTVPVPDTEKPTELGIPVPYPAEQNYLSYTVETGKARFAKQFGTDDGTYDKFVEQVRKGEISQEMKNLIQDYQMSKMVIPALNADGSLIEISLDRPEITATTLLLMSESYPAIAKTIHNVMTNPEQKVSQTDVILMKKYFNMAKAAANNYKANSDSNLLSDIDYGLYGATKKTNKESVKFESQKDRDSYNALVKDVFVQKDGNNY